MLFMGEEWGASTPWQFFTSFPDPELAQAVRDGRRREFAAHGWKAEQVPDPQDPATFERSHLDWSEPEKPDHARILAFYRELIALRRTIPAGTPATEVAADGDAFVFRRGELRIRVSLRGHGLATGDLPGEGEAVLAYGDAVRVTRAG